LPIQDLLDWDAISIPTAPTNHLPDWLGLNENARWQKGADKPDDPVREQILSGTSDNRIPQFWMIR
jgi:hypothetical protein